MRQRKTCGTCPIRKGFECGLLEIEVPNTLYGSNEVFTYVPFWCPLSPKDVLKRNTPNPSTYWIFANEETQPLFQKRISPRQHRRISSVQIV